MWARREGLSRKADAVEVYRLLDRKADAAAVTEALAHKASQASWVGLCYRARQHTAQRACARF